MERKSIVLEDLTVKMYHLWDIQTLLLTAGDYSLKQYNAMVVGWGSCGCIWGKPFAQILVRPTRYTYTFTEKFPTFTLCAFPEEYHDGLTVLGTKSGRNSNKIAESGLTPVASQHVAAPSFAEASLVLECRKLYWQDLDPTHFIDPELDRAYPAKNDYHRIYFGEIIAAYGTPDFSGHA